jgi:hypothetical protein
MVETRSTRRNRDAPPRNTDFPVSASKKSGTNHSRFNPTPDQQKNTSRTLTDKEWRQKKMLGLNDFICGTQNHMLMLQQRRCRNSGLANIRRGTGYRATIDIQNREEYFYKLKEFSQTEKIIKREEKEEADRVRDSRRNAVLGRRTSENNGETTSNSQNGQNNQNSILPFYSQNSPTYTVLSPLGSVNTSEMEDDEVDSHGDNSDDGTEFSEADSVSSGGFVNRIPIQNIPPITPATFDSFTYLKKLTERKSMMIDNQTELSPRPSNSDGTGVTPAKSTYCVAYSPCGKYSAVANAPHFLTVINNYTKKIEKYFRKTSLMSRSPWSLSWHKVHSDLVATACLNGEVRIWNVFAEYDSSMNTETEMADGVNTDLAEAEKVERIQNKHGFSLKKLKRNSNVRISCDFHPTEKVLLIVQGEIVTLWNFGNTKNPQDITQYKLDNTWHALYCKFDIKNPKAFYLAVDQASPKPSSLAGKTNSGGTRRYTPSELVHHRPSGGQNQTPMIQRMRIQAIQQAMNLSAANAGAGDHNPVLQASHMSPNPNLNIRSPSGMVQTMRMPTTTTMYYVEFEKSPKTVIEPETRHRKTAKSTKSTVPPQNLSKPKDRNGQINEKGIFKIVSEPNSKKYKSTEQRVEQNIQDLPSNVFISKVTRNAVVFNQHSVEVSPCGKYIAMLCQIVKDDPRTFDKGSGLKPGPFNPETEPERIAGNSHGCLDPHYNEDPNSGNPNNNVTNPNAPNSGQTVDQVYANNATGGIFPLAHGGTALVWDNLPMPSPAIETPAPIRRIEYNNQLASQGKEPEELRMVVRIFSTVIANNDDPNKSPGFTLLYQIKADQAVSVSWSPTSQYLCIGVACKFVQHDGQDRLPHPNSDVGIKNVMYGQIYHLSHNFQESTKNSKDMVSDDEFLKKDPRTGIKHVRNIFNHHELINEIETNRLDTNGSNSMQPPRRQYLPNCVSFAPSKSGMVSMIIGLSNGKIVLQSCGLNVLQQRTLEESRVENKSKKTGKIESITWKPLSEVRYCRELYHYAHFQLTQTSSDITNWSRFDPTNPLQLIKPLVFSIRTGNFPGQIVLPTSFRRLTTNIQSRQVGGRNMLFELLRENAQRPENTVPGQNSRLVTAFQATYQHTLEQQQRALQQIRRNIQLSYAAVNTTQHRRSERDARHQLENMNEVIRSAPRTATVLEAVSRNLSDVDREMRAFFQPLRNTSDGSILPAGVINHPQHRTEQDGMNYRNEVDDEMSVIRTNQQYQADLTETQEIAQLIRDQTNLDIPAIDYESSILEGYQQAVNNQPTTHTLVAPIDNWVARDNPHQPDPTNPTLGENVTVLDVARQAQDLINRSRELSNYLNDQRHINATYVSGSMPSGTQPAPNTPLSNFPVEPVSTNTPSTSTANNANNHAES